MRPHARHFSFSLGAPDEDGKEDFFIHGSVRARTPEKAHKKARRIQIATGWPLLSLAPEHQSGSHFERRRHKKLVRKGLEEPMTISSWKNGRWVERQWPAPRPKKNDVLGVREALFEIKRMRGDIAHKRTQIDLRDRELEITEGVLVSLNPK